MKKIFSLWAAGALGLPVALAGVSAVPAFESASIYAEAKGKASEPALEYRAAGENAWKTSIAPVLSPEGKELRGALWDLEEGTQYEYRVRQNGSFESGTFTTRTAKVPIARTIVLTQESFNGHLELNESGTPEGYVRYTAKPGTILLADGKHHDAIRGKGARYVILEGLTIRGGNFHCINLEDCEDVRVLNCDIAGFGAPELPYVLEEGRQHLLTTAGKGVVNHESGIFISGGKNVVAERNFIHDARGRSNSWFFAHPAGPNGICICKCDAPVIRWNDMIGSDHHRWNDVIESGGNGEPWGGPKRDAEIFGNYLAFGDDDSIELDGGQQLVRLRFNRLEGSYSGVSTAPSINGPGFVVQNLTMKQGEEFGLVGSILKHSYRYFPGRIFVFGNTMVNNSKAYVSPFGAKGVTPEQRKLLKLVSRNNLFCSPETPQYKDPELKCDADYDFFSGMEPLEIKSPVHEKHALRGTPDFVDAANGDFSTKGALKGEKLPVFGDTVGIPCMMPMRPLALKTSVYTLSLDRKILKKTVTVTSSGYDGRFTVTHPEDSCIRVTPASGSIRPGESVTLTVEALPEAAADARLHCSAFLVRTPEGLSRPVSVYYDDRDDAEKVALARSKVVYGEVKAVSKGEVELQFKGVPEGQYYLAVWFTAMPNWAGIGFPGGKLQRVRILRQPGTNFGWARVNWGDTLVRDSGPRSKVRQVCMPRKVSGDLSFRLRRPEKLDPKPVYCALFHLPEEFFYAPQTLTAKEKSLPRPEK